MDTLVIRQLYLRLPSQTPFFSTPIQPLYFYIPVVLCLGQKNYVDQNNEVVLKWDLRVLRIEL